MKILLTGGGSGGHFYPIIAVAQAINKIAKENKLIDVQLYYMAPQPYDAQAVYETKMTFVKSSAGKMRQYFSILNFFDVFRTAWGAWKAIWTIFNIYPDVVFGKGGSVSFPALFAARLFRIPVIIHESDSYPGRTNMWAGKFARRIAVSFPEAAQYFKPDRVAHTGNPVRTDITHPEHEGGKEYFNLEPNVPVVLILGGSQGSQIINENVLDALPTLVNKYQIIHQAGKNNLAVVQETANVVLMNNEHKSRYKLYDHLNNLTMRMAAGAADVIVSRAGSTIFEIALWGVPSLLVPIEKSNGDHQRKNAYGYARTGAALVIEENNLTAHILISEIERVLSNPELKEKMKLAAKGFARPDSAELIAKEILNVALEHER